MIRHNANAHNEPLDDGRVLAFTLLIGHLSQPIQMQLFRLFYICLARFMQSRPCNVSCNNGIPGPKRQGKATTAMAR